jgi:DNA sulfur modification protein DndB
LATFLAISLPFMCFLGLTQREEMEVFNIINSKAKGLSPSLLDFHAATLATDLATERPELLIALQLHDNTESPWHQQLDLGGSATSGMHRRASLRTMQKAVKRFLVQTHILERATPEQVALIVLGFWAAVSEVLPSQWATPRKHLLNKGVGVYALMTIAADLVAEAANNEALDQRYFTARLADFLPNVNWTRNGTLRGLGGEAGVKQAVEFLRVARRKAHLRAVKHG